MRSEILRPAALDDIPSHLKSIFDGENKVIDEMQAELDVHNECGFVYLISQEIIQSQFFDDSTRSVNLPNSMSTNQDF